MTQSNPLPPNEAVGSDKQIVATQPDGILNAINGDNNNAFFKALQRIPAAFVGTSN